MVPKPTAVEFVYLQVPGVKGPVTTPGCTGCIDLESYQWGGARATGAAFTPQQLQIVKRADATSPIFSKHLSAGLPFTGTTKLEVVQPGTVKPYLVFQFTNVYTTSISWSTSGDAPTETIQFVYGGLEICYTPQRGGTSNCASWRRHK
jgi:type VI protein secretion system component Hcp